MSYYCTQKRIICEFANLNGYCSITACTKLMTLNTINKYNGTESKSERTCHNFGGEEGTNGEYYDFGCSACGYCCDLPEPNFCPHCGARVTD